MMTSILHGKKAWLLEGSNHLEQPFFPYGNITKTFEFSPVGRRDSSEGPPIYYQTFADCMEPVEGSIPLREAVNELRTKKTDEPHGETT